MHNKSDQPVNAKDSFEEKEARLGSTDKCLTKTPRKQRRFYCCISKDNSVILFIILDFINLVEYDEINPYEDVQSLLRN